MNMERYLAHSEPCNQETDTCDLCFEPNPLTYCDACGLRYCRKCAMQRDEQGFNCPGDNCPQAPLYEDPAPEFSHGDHTQDYNYAGYGY